MVCLNQIADAVAHTIGDPYNYYLKEKIKDKAIALRSTLLRQEYTKGFISQQLIQTLGCIEVKCVDIAECCCVSADLSVLRTTKVIPMPLRVKNDLFYFVGTVKKEQPFLYCNHEEIEYVITNRFNGNYPRYSYRNGYIYVFNPPSKAMDFITVESIFDDPRVASNFCDCDDKPCYTDDSPIYFPNDLRLAVDKLLEEEFGRKEVKESEVSVDDN